MARIPAADLERLKEEVSVQRLVEGAGIELKRAGKDWLGRCPFHDDREASLVVTPGKNLWHGIVKLPRIARCNRRPDLQPLSLERAPVVSRQQVLAHIEQCCRWCQTRSEISERAAQT